MPEMNGGPEVKEFKLNQRLTALLSQSILEGTDHRFALRKDLQPRDIHGLFMRAFEGLDPHARSQYAELAIKFDRDVPLVGTRGIPQFPFIINPELFELAGRDEDGGPLRKITNKSGEQVHEISLGQAALLFVQLPLLFYRMRVIDALHLQEAILYGDAADQKTSTDSLVEYAGYLHIVTKIRSAVEVSEIGDEAINQRAHARRSALEALSNAFNQIPGYEPLARLIDFALSNESNFAVRQSLARNMAASPIYGAAALSTDLETLCDTQEFTKRLIKDVGGLYPDNRTNLLSELEKSISDAGNDLDALGKVLVRLANDEDLELSPIAPLRLLDFHSWLEGLSRKDRWTSFKLLNDEQKLNLLVQVEEAFKLRDRLLVTGEGVHGAQIDEILPKVFLEGSRENLTVGLFLSELAQLTERLESQGISQQMIIDLSTLIDFFNSISALVERDDISPETVGAVLDRCLNARVNEVPATTSTERSKEIRDLVYRLKGGDSDYSDVINVLRISSGKESNLIAGELPSARQKGEALPSTISQWILYVWSQKHTHSLSALIDGESEAVIERNAKLHVQLMYAALPIYALCDTILDWDPWIENLQLQDPTMSQAMLIAFEARTERLTHFLSEVMRQKQDPTSIWHNVFTSERFEGLSESSNKAALELRDEFLKRVEDLREKGILSVS